MSKKKESGLKVYMDNECQSYRIYGIDGNSRTLTSAEGGGLGGGVRTGLYAIPKEGPKIETILKGEHQHESVQLDEGLAKTICARDYKDPQRVAQPRKIIDGSQGERVYRHDDIAVTLSANGGGLGAKTGLYAVPKDSKTGCKPYLHGDHQGEWIYGIDGNSRTLTSANGSGGIGGGNRTGLYAVPCITPDRIEKRQNGRRFKETEDPMFTLTAQDKHGVLLYNDKEYYIRKLTPRECFRLQGFPDELFEKAQAVNSNTQLYKQAGNAVTTTVAKALGEYILYMEERIK